MSFPSWDLQLHSAEFSVTNMFCKIVSPQERAYVVSAGASVILLYSILRPSLVSGFLKASLTILEHGVLYPVSKLLSVCQTVMRPDVQDT